MEEKKALMVCLPGWNFTTPWVSNWTALFSVLEKRFELEVVFGYSNNIYITRNNLLQNVFEFVKQGNKLDYVLWMDDDNILDSRQFNELMRDLEKNPRVDGVMGWYWLQPQGRQIDPKVSVGNLEDDGSKFVTFDPKRMFREPPLERVDGGGMGAFLCRWECLEKVGEKAFIPVILPDDKEHGFAGDDIAFFIRAKELGMEFVVDKRVKVPHLKVREAEFDVVPFLEMPVELVPALYIDGWMDHNELKWLHQKAGEMKTVVEIGSWKGRSSFALASGCKDGIVYCVDTWNGSIEVDTSQENKTLAQIASEQDIFGQFLNNIRQFKNVVPAKITSIEAAKEESGKVDMVFIDGDHTLEGVLADLDSWRSKATKLLCGHDIDREEVRKALEIRGIDYKRGPGLIWFHEVAKEQQAAA